MSSRATSKVKSWRLVGSSPNQAYILSKYLTVKFVLLLALRLEILCKIVELLGVLFSISVWLKMTFLSLEGSYVTTGRLELSDPAASKCPELDAPGVVLVTLSQSG